MAWSSGTFTRTNGTYSGATVWNQDRLAGTKITSANHDTHDQDIATGINACLNKNGQNSPTANIDWGGFKITNHAVATASGQVVVYQQLLAPIILVCGDETTAITVGTDKVKIRAPYAIAIQSCKCSLSTAQASGSIFTVDILVSGVSILSTKLTITNVDTTSTLAIVAPVLSVATIVVDAEISISVTQIGNGTAKGLKVCLLGKYTP